MKMSLMRPIMIMNRAAKTLPKCLPWFGHSSGLDPISSQVSGSASIFCGSSFAPMAWFVSWATWRDRQAVPWPCASRLSAFTASPVVVGCRWLKKCSELLHLKFSPFFKIGISIFRIWVWMRVLANSFLRLAKLHCLKVVLAANLMPQINKKIKSTAGLQNYFRWVFQTRQKLLEAKIFFYHNHQLQWSQRYLSIIIISCSDHNDTCRLLFPLWHSLNVSARFNWNFELIVQRQVSGRCGLWNLGGQSSREGASVPTRLCFHSEFLLKQTLSTCHL
jgi:hypothetical protein